MLLGRYLKFLAWEQDQSKALPQYGQREIVRKLKILSFQLADISIAHLEFLVLVHVY